MRIAASKLTFGRLGIAGPRGVTFSDDMKLACLAMRLGLDFRATNWLDQQAPERIQVERHLRLCLAATPGFTELVTISPSEPLLAEAAYSLTSRRSGLDDLPPWSMPIALQSHLTRSYLDLGNRGELIASLLITLARDAALDKEPFPSPDLPPDDDGEGRVVSVAAFLAALVTADEDNLLNLKPRCARDTTLKDVTLRDAFSGARIWFNHIVKVRDFAMVRRENLCALVARGAAMLCADNQKAVDLLIPIVFNGYLKPENVSAILIQVKNSLSYESVGGVDTLLDAIDPFNIELFDEKDVIIRPVIRMVFTLSPRDHRVSLTRPPPKSEPKIPFTAYDIGCLGLGKATFRVIKDTEEDTYQNLLRRSQGISGAYTLGGVKDNSEVAKLRRAMHAAAWSKREHMTFMD